MTQISQVNQINPINHITLVDYVNEAGIYKCLIDTKNFCYEKLDNPIIRYYTFNADQYSSAKANAYLKDSDKSGLMNDIIRKHFDEELFIVSKDNNKSFSEIKKTGDNYKGEINRLRRRNFYQPWSKAYDNHPIQRNNMKAIEAAFALDVIIGSIPNEHSFWILGAIYLAAQGIKRSKIRRGYKKQLKSIEEPLRQYDLFQENLLKASMNGAVEVTHFPEAEIEVADFIASRRKNMIKTKSNRYNLMDYDGLNDFIANRYGVDKEKSC
jgi:hypothetical protein